MISPELQPQLDEILARSRADFTAHNRRRFSEGELVLIREEAARRLAASLSEKQASTSQELAAAWQKVVEDFYENDYWGFGRSSSAEGTAKAAPAPVSEPSDTSEDKNFLKFIRIAFVPTLVTKSFIIYFGLNYSLYPGEGYGYGLVATIVFTLSSFLIFVYKQTRTSTES